MAFQEERFGGQTSYSPAIWVNVTVSYKDGIIFIEAKYLAPVSLRTTHDSRRDQVIRYLDLAAYHYLNHPDAVKELYFILIIDTEKPPWVLTRYRYNQNLIKGLTNPGLFKPPVDTGRLLSKGLGWLSWKQLRKILEITRGHFGTSASDPFYPCQIPSSYIFSYVPQFH